VHTPLTNKSILDGGSMTASTVDRRRGRTVLRLAVAAAAGAGSILLTAGPAPAAQPSYVRLAHFSPDTPDVDVYLTSYSRPGWQMLLRGVGYGALSPYQRVDPGLYTVAMRKAGAAASTPAVISTSVRAASGGAYTVAGVGPYANLGLTVLRDDLSLPPRNAVRVRVLQASARAKTVSVKIANGPTIASTVDFARSTSYSTVPAGQWNLSVSSIGQPNLDVTMPVTLAAGDVYSVLVLDDEGGGLKVVTRTDAASGAVMPTGGVETGAGGTAPAEHRVPWLPAGLGTAGLLLLGTAAARRHRGRTPRTADLATAGR
jgi:hypothetical protein